MKKIWLIALLSIVVFAGCAEDENQKKSPRKGKGYRTQFVLGSVRNANPGLGPALVVGDSLAFGTGAKDMSVIPSGCLENAFQQPTSNRAWPGLKSGEILERIPAALDESPKLIFVSSGGNDVLQNMRRPGSYPTSRTLREMDEMFDQLLATGAVVIYLGLKPPVPGAERLPAIAKLAQEKGVIVVDGMRGFWGNPDLMADQLHPNDKGYRILCDRILEALQGHYP